jgi:hypothetical protein
MSQNDEEILLKSVRVLYKSGYTEEARQVLQKMDSPQAKTLLSKMGGASKAPAARPYPLLGLGFGFLAVALLAFVLGWTLSPKTPAAVLENPVDNALAADADAEAAATATAGRLRFEATGTALTGANENIMTQISASATAAIEAATATAAAQGQ